MCIWLLVASLSLGGQTLWPDGTWCVPSGTTPERMLLEERNLWLGSTNPAALGVRPMPDYGTTRLGATSESGAYRRPQQAAEAVSAGFLGALVAGSDGTQFFLLDPVQTAP